MSMEANKIGKIVKYTSERYVTPLENTFTLSGLVGYDTRLYDPLACLWDKETENPVENSHRKPLIRTKGDITRPSWYLSSCCNNRMKSKTHRPSRQLVLTTSSSLFQSIYKIGRWVNHAITSSLSYNQTQDQYNQCREPRYSADGIHSITRELGRE
jgi:hypothetical protein